MTTSVQQFATEQTKDLIEATIRARRQVSAADLCVALSMPLDRLRRFTRPLAVDGRIHRVRPMGGGAPRGGIWAAGPDPVDLSNEEGTAEPVHLFSRTWPAPKVQFAPLEMCLFGRAAAPEVRA
ncbi:MAG: hypothetical protein K2X55_10260 [Burkholderiaceae bacterium]|nr:hypothetical protein [Burkholderiaceae bacterium]